MEATPRSNSPKLFLAFPLPKPNDLDPESYPPLQPKATLALVAHTPDGKWTAITRSWKRGEAANCRLCPAGCCTATRQKSLDLCTIQAEGHVDGRDALAYSSVGLSWGDGNASGERR